MRRLEYVGGNSEKFWEASCEDAAVTVRWGRLGTAGQTKRKEFADSAAAESFLDTQAAAKLRKGYREIGEGQAVGSPAAPVGENPVGESPAGENPVVESASDEDVFEPGTLVRSAYPRRDQGRAKHKVAPEGAGAFVERHLRSLTPVFEGGDREIREAVARYSGGEADPLGAAGTAVALAAVVGYQERRELGKLASEWVLRHGVAFAAVVTVLAAEVVSEPRSKVLRRALPGDRLPWGSVVDEVRGDVRRALAAADDGQYAEAVAAIVALDLGDAGACVAAFLLPTETALVERAVAVVPRVTGAITAACVLGAIGTPEQLAAVPRFTAHRGADRDGRVVATLLRALGAGAAAAFAEWLEGADAELTRRLLAALVEMPTDDAFTELLVRVEGPQVRPALQEAVRRYPRRAARLLAAAAVADEPWSPAARDLLRSHLVAFPALLERLAPAEREVASTLLVGVERLPDAPVESLPEVLRVPPWTRPKPAPPVVVPGLPVTAAPRIAWLPDEERAAAAEREVNLLYHRRTTDWAVDVAQRARRGTVAYPTYLHAPLELVVPLIGSYRPSSTWRVESWGAALLERF
ncbi:MAG TPA: WGR domain-containing protein, partial [Umezawaea sp.]|nr:WGR domain-containing protein [Umezawaea sp.]